MHTAASNEAVDFADTPTISWYGCTSFPAGFDCQGVHDELSNVVLINLKSSFNE